MVRNISYNSELEVEAPWEFTEETSQTTQALQSPPSSLGAAFRPFSLSLRCLRHRGRRFRAAQHRYLVLVLLRRRRRRLEEGAPFVSGRQPCE